MNEKYFVKDIVRLTGVTARALHYYDEIGLLEPSGRTPSDYRFYTEKDLLRLQQILTLKLMGFTLDQVKILLQRRGYAVKKYLAIQVQALNDEAARIKTTARTLSQVLAFLEKEERLDWKKIIKVMEDINMSEQAKKDWYNKFFTEKDRKEFEELGKRFTPGQIEAYEKKWAGLIAEVKQNLHLDPASEAAQSLARRWQTLLEEGGYGDFPNLQKKIKAAYGAGAYPEEYMPKDVWDFIKKAKAARP